MNLCVTAVSYTSVVGGFTNHGELDCNRGFINRGVLDCNRGRRECEGMCKDGKDVVPYNF